ncbi:vacuolar transporter chaperone, partial [Blyttiomyces sp. JEL0837]
MKFGRSFDEEVYKEWKFYAVDYKALKTRLKARPFTEADEKEFVQALDRELDKVFAFCGLKHGELTRRIEYMEHTMQGIAHGAPTEDAKHERLLEDGESGDSGAHAEDEGAATRSRLNDVDNEIAMVTGEVKELAGFAGLNYTAIYKILKKHDKRTPFSLKTEFRVRMNSKPFFEQTYEEMILRLSDLWDTVRYMHGGSSTKDKSPGVDSQNIVRKTTKYWVHL